MKVGRENLHCNGIHLSQGRKRNLLLSLEVLDRIRTAGLAARVGLLRTAALALGTTILGLLVRKQQRNAVAATQNEDHGDDQRRNDPALPHALTVRAFLGLVKLPEFASSVLRPCRIPNVVFITPSTGSEAESKKFRKALDPVPRYRV